MTKVDWRRISFQFLPSSVLIVLIVKFVCIFSPFANYTFDWDPSDGDFLNVVHRISLKLPLYSDWRSGHVLNLYMPLIHYLAWGGSILGFDELRFVRALNLFALLVSIGCVFFLARRIFSDSALRNSYGVLGTIGFLINWETFGNFASFRPDPILLAISSLAVCSVVFDASVLLTAALCILAVLAKQAGVVIVAAAIICVWVFNRKKLVHFCGALAGFSSAVAVFGVVSGNSLIWRSCFLDPNAYLVRTPEWDSLWTLFRGLCNGKSLWIYAIAAYGVYSSVAEKCKIGTVCIIFLIVDAIYLLRTAASPGAGVSYFWFQWFLCLILATLGARFIVRRFGSRGTATVFALIFLALDGRALLRLAVSPGIDLRDCTRISQDHLSLIRPFTEQDGNWVAERNAVALVKSGKILDQEMCTFGAAASGSKGAEMALAFSRELASGKYRFYQRESQRTFLMPQDVDRVLDLAFRKVADSKVIYRGQPKSVEILEFIPKPLSTD